MRVFVIAASLILLSLTAFADVPSNLIVVRDGFDWVWAAPCSPVEPSCNASGHNLTLSFGYTIPTSAEWLASFTNTLDVYNAFTLNGTTQLCASSYFDSGYTNCDSGDVQEGAIWGAPVPIGDPVLSTNPNADAFLVKSASAPVPEPSSLILLFSAGIGTVIARRRRRV